MDSQKGKAEEDDRDIELSGTSRRQRSINSVVPEGAASSGGGLAHRSQSRIVRPRSRSSTSTTYPENAGPLCSLGESVDISALSVEVAVAEARESQYSPAKADRKHGRRTSASHSRSSSVYNPKSRPGTPSRRGSASRVKPQERGSRSSSKVSGSVGNIVDEDEGNVDEESQAVIRRHQPHHSRPSIIDVFNLPQPNTASYSRPPRSRSPSVSLAGEELAASRLPDEPRRLSSVSPRCSKPSDLGGLESEVDSAESCAPRVDRGKRSPRTKSTQDHNEAVSQPGAAGIPSRSSSVLSSITWLHDEPGDLQDSISCVLEEEKRGGGSATVVTAANEPANDRIVEAETGESLGEGEVQVRHHVQREGSPASNAQKIQRCFFDGRQSDSPGGNRVGFDGFMEGEIVPVAPDSHPTESAQSTARSHPLQSEEDPRVSSTSKELKNALSSTADDANGMDHALSAGLLPTDWHPAVEVRNKWQNTAFSYVYGGK